MKMMAKRAPLWLGLGVVCVTMGTGLPAAAAAQGSPVDAVRSRNLAVQETLKAEGDSVSDATRERLKDVINGLIDFTELSRRSLGRHWDERTEAERADFVDVFRQLVRNSSVRKLGIHRADSLVYRTPEITGEEAVLTTVAWKDGKSAEIVYYMHWAAGEWKAWDVVVDGSSTMRTYRDSFNREIRATSFTAMVARLRERLAEDSGTQR
jgi:phospholipid transport system substrate-binding protein